MAQQMRGHSYKVTTALQESGTGEAGWDTDQQTGRQRKKNLKIMILANLVTAVSPTDLLFQGEHQSQLQQVCLPLRTTQ